jgi:hypothetical protein
MQMLGAIQAIMDWRGASICTRVDTGRSIGHRRFPRSVCTSKGTPPRRSCHSFRVIDRLPKHAVLDQPMIKAYLRHIAIETMSASSIQRLVRVGWSAAIPTPCLRGVILLSEFRSISSCCLALFGARLGFVLGVSLLFIGCVSARPLGSREEVAGKVVEHLPTDVALSFLKKLEEHTREHTNFHTSSFAVQDAYTTRYPPCQFEKDFVRFTVLQSAYIFTIGRKEVEVPYAALSITDICGDAFCIGEQNKVSGIGLSEGTAQQDNAETLFRMISVVGMFLPDEGWRVCKVYFPPNTSRMKVGSALATMGVRYR